MSELFRAVRLLVNDDRKGNVRQAVRQAQRNHLAQSTIDSVFQMRDSHWYRQAPGWRRKEVMDKQFKAGQVWETRDGYEATIKQVGGIGEFPVWVKIERLDESFSVRADGTGRTNSDDLVGLLHDVEVAA